MGVKISQFVTEILASPSEALALVTTLVAEVVVANAYSTPGAITGAGVSQKVMEVVMVADGTAAKVSQQVLEVVFSDTAATDISASYPLVID